MTVKVDERHGIAWINDFNDKDNKRAETNILFEGCKDPVVLFKKGTKKEMTAYIFRMFPNVVPVHGWVYNYEIDSVLLFDERSDTKYSRACRFPT